MTGISVQLDMKISSLHFMIVVSFITLFLRVVLLLLLQSMSFLVPNGSFSFCCFIAQKPHWSFLLIPPNLAQAQQVSPLCLMIGLPLPLISSPLQNMTSLTSFSKQQEKETGACPYPGGYQEEIETECSC